MALTLADPYEGLSADLFTPCWPTAIRDARIVCLNQSLAKRLSLSEDDVKALPYSLHTKKPASNLFGQTPCAMAYAGHQFGHFVPVLGDGRALLLGGLQTSDGIWYDFHLKGAGITPFSRGGDGRAALGPILREHLVSTFMQAMGVPTTESLIAFTTSEDIFREKKLPGAALIRIGKSHIRFGTFQYLAYRKDWAGLKTLADFVISRHYPDAARQSNPYTALFESIVKRQATLIAKWQSLGFIHGVMNTDNMQIAGETLDYGPCAFMDHFDNERVFSSIDHRARYAYGAQPKIGYWNLSCLASSLLPLFDDDEDRSISLAEEKLENYLSAYEAHYLDCFRKKVGLQSCCDGDNKLINDFLTILQNEKADFTLSFRRLSDYLNTKPQEDDLSPDKRDWLHRWRLRRLEDSLAPEAALALMDSYNPLYIPRNHLVEKALTQAVDDFDLTLYNDLYTLMQHPSMRRNNAEPFICPPRPDEVIKATFCGT